jgi:tRNA G26 N,N-dimethylase Trm1
LPWHPVPNPHLSVEASYARAIEKHKAEGREPPEKHPAPVERSGEVRVDGPHTLAQPTSASQIKFIPGQRGTHPVAPWRGSYIMILEVKILDALSASGLRAFRYILEIEVAALPSLPRALQVEAVGLGRGGEGTQPS